MHAPERTTPRALAILVAGLAACVVLAGLVTQAGPRATGRAPQAEALMLDLVNRERDVHGLRPLEAAPDVADVAWRWSQRMAGSGELAHNPRAADEVCCWSVVAENVAFSDAHAVWLPGDPVARVTRELHEALLASPSHRANLLHRQVDQVGIGIHVDRDGTVWVTQNFRRHEAG